jgi:hypothetical protein
MERRSASADRSSKSKTRSFSEEELLASQRKRLADAESERVNRFLARYSPGEQKRRREAAVAMDEQDRKDADEELRGLSDEERKKRVLAEQKQVRRDAAKLKYRIGEMTADANSRSRINGRHCKRKCECGTDPVGAVYLGVGRMKMR